VKKKLTTEQIIAAKRNKITQQKLAKVYGVTERTIWNWKRKDDSFIKKKRPRFKIKDEALETLINHVTKNSTATQRKMVDYLQSQLEFSVHQSTISRTLKRLNFTRKKISLHFSEQIPIWKTIEQSVQILKSLPEKKIICLDECGFGLNEVPRYGYAPRGQRVFTWKPGKSKTYHSLILTLQITESNGIFSYQLIKGGLNTQKFHDFLSAMNLPTDEDYYLVMDNLSVHKSNKTCRKLGLSTISELLSSKNITPLYLPPYTPELNPVEFCFNTIKDLYRQEKPRTEEELQCVVEKTIDSLQNKDLTKYFQHCLGYPTRVVF